VILCIGGGLIAFGLVWHIWWLVIVAAASAFAAIVARGFARDVERIIPASEVEQTHMRWLSVVAASRPITRAREVEPVNAGLAAHPLREAAE
jgi:cytochrome o ubiquinol oxidase subunit I